MLSFGAVNPVGTEISRELLSRVLDLVVMDELS